MTTASEINRQPDFNTRVIEEFRANDGVLSGPFENVDMMLLTTTGRKSGREHVIPLAYRREGDAVVVFGSYAGNPKHPQWILNLIANPDVTVEVGSETYPARARIAAGDERERIWAAQKADIPQFGDYEQTTRGREIPVVILERRRP